jgi:hypothetical protein
VLPPTAIRLDFFSALRQTEGVALRWRTSFESNTAGFMLLRAPANAIDDPAAAVQLTDVLVPAAGASGGATYGFVDSTARPGVAYVYWLVEVELSGRQTRYGPAIASNRHSLHLPIIGQNTN